MCKNVENPYILAIKDVFNKSTINDLKKNYRKIFKEYDKWMMFSDYYFDEQKPNYCFTFSFLPYYTDIFQLMNKINEVAPKDIKNTKSVSQDFMTFLKNIPVINFVFVMNKNDYFTWLTKDAFVRCISANVQILLNKCEEWKKPENEPYYNQLKRKLQEMKIEIETDKKIKIMAQMVFVTMVGAYITSELDKFIKFKMFGWFSDRDKINDLYSNISIDFFHQFLYEFSKRGDFQFNGGSADCKSDEWYKELTRISDYLTGTLADYNIEENAISHAKFGELIKGYIADNEKNCFIFRIKFNTDNYECGRFLIQNEA